MIPHSKVIYVYKRKINHTAKVLRIFNKLGTALVVVSLGGLTGPLTPFLRLEGSYYASQVQEVLINTIKKIQVQANNFILSNQVTNNQLTISPTPTPYTLPPTIQPVSPDFSLIIPKISVNAPVIPAVNPAQPGEYINALKLGVAHSSTSFLPDEDGTVFLFSHSTNYDWFVKDLNAVFYLLKNLDVDDIIVVFYKGKQYTYKLTEKRVVSPTEVSYLLPIPGPKRLILQTCWPPGDTTQRLLIFADLEN